MSIESSLPWHGTVNITVDTNQPIDFDLSLRVPKWSESTSIHMDGEMFNVDGEESYTTISRTWDTAEIDLKFNQSINQIEAHPAVEADAGRIALTRGPLVYCIEATDNDQSLHQYAIPTEADIEVNQKDELLNGVSTLTTDAIVPDRSSWGESDLYLSREITESEESTVTAVPYYAWDNRDPGPMKVWIRSN